MLAELLFTLVAAPIAKAYIPIGFDDKNVSQVVVAGEFVSTCYKIGPSHARVDEVNRIVTIRQDAYRYSKLCLQVAVPYNQAIDIGILSPGVYSIVDGATGKELGSLPVAKGVGPGPDDYLYAPMTDAYVETTLAPVKTHTLVLKGQFSDRCTTMTEIRVLPYTDVITVQPITERTGGGEECRREPARFLMTKALDPSLKGNYLLHVRSLNGQAINKVINLP